MRLLLLGSSCSYHETGKSNWKFQTNVCHGVGYFLESTKLIPCTHFWQGTSCYNIPNNIIIFCVLSPLVSTQGVFCSGRDTFWDSINMCAPITPLYRGSGSMPPAPAQKRFENSCPGPEIEFGGLWQLADYPTLVF